MAKIVRFLLILITIFTLSFYLPSLYRRTVEKRPLKTMIYFSEVSHDFVIARESIDSTTREAAMLYYDTRGNLLTETEYMQLLPFNNRRKLKLMGLMPDSLDGVALTTDVLKNVKRSMLVADRSFSYGLAPLFESAPERVGVSLPDDIFRIGKRGIEFIDCTTGEILPEKSARFAQAMQAAGFEAPARDIYGIPSVIKRWDSGYFITDRNGRLFHLMMVKGAPYCRHIKTGFEIKNIKCHTDEEIFCHIFDTDNRLYVLTTDYRLLPAPGRDTHRSLLHDLERLLPHLQDDRERHEHTLRPRPVVRLCGPTRRENRPLRRHPRSCLGETSLPLRNDEDTGLCPLHTPAQPGT